MAEPYSLWRQSVDTAPTQGPGDHVPVSVGREDSWAPQQISSSLWRQQTWLQTPLRKILNYSTAWSAAAERRKHKIPLNIQLYLTSAIIQVSVQNIRSPYRIMCCSLCIKDRCCSLYKLWPLLLNKSELAIAEPNLYRIIERAETADENHLCVAVSSGIAWTVL